MIINGGKKIIYKQVSRFILKQFSEETGENYERTESRMFGIPDEVRRGHLLNARAKCY